MVNQNRKDHQGSPASFFYSKDRIVPFYGMVAEGDYVEEIAAMEVVVQSCLNPVPLIFQ